VLHGFYTVLARTGRVAREQWLDLQYLVAMVGTVLWVSLKPRHWRPTVRNVLARQLLFTGVESLRFTALVAILVGISVVVQTSVWLGKVGLSQMAGPVLVLVVARELGPFLANIIVMIRSGSAIATELAVMKVTGEVRVLEAQGIEPFIYLVMPRVLAMLVATFCLTLVFITLAFAGGYLFGALNGDILLGPMMFLSSVAKSVQPVDVLNIFAKSIIPAMLTGVICSMEGLRAGNRLTEAPLAAKRALSRSVVMLFFVFALISLLTYW